MIGYNSMTQIQTVSLSLALLGKSGLWWTPVSASRRATTSPWSGYCAIACGPPPAIHRPHKEGTALVYRFPTQTSEPAADKRVAKVDEIKLRH